MHVYTKLYIIFFYEQYNVRKTQLKWQLFIVNNGLSPLRGPLSHQRPQAVTHLNCWQAVPLNKSYFLTSDYALLSTTVIYILLN